MHIPSLIFKIIHWIFAFYTFSLFLRVVGSWFPKYAYHPIMRFIRLYTDPYLNLFRKLIPPIGGALDLSPILGFFALEIMERTLTTVIKTFL